MLRFVLFLAVACGILGLLHWYIWLRLVRDTALSGGGRTVATAAIVSLGVALPASFVVGRLMSAATARIVLFPVYVWMGVMFLILCLLLALDGAKLVAWIAAKVVPALRGAFDPTRRIAISRLTGGAVALVAAGLGAVAIQQAARRVGVREVKVRLDRLPVRMHGTTIVQVTDIHVGSLQGRKFIEDMVETINRLDPDVIAITGDLVDGTVDRLRDAVAPLGELRARYGTFFVTGNHEYYATPDPAACAAEWTAELTRLGVRVLHNERVRIGDDGAGYDLAGVPDWSARGYGAALAPDLARALSGRDESQELVLLAHQPKAIADAAKHGVGLQISGHTHGGQIWPWRYMVRLDQPFVSGLGRQGDTQIYVSRGTGTWGPPMRLAEPAEITRIVLEAKQA
jgi:predicted MPP superfamily phosphohydrolase